MKRLIIKLKSQKYLTNILSINTVNNLGILAEKENETFAENHLSEVKMALKKYKNHPSINAITKRIKSLGNFAFSFNFISHDDIVKELSKLESKEAAQKTDIPIKIGKENVDMIFISCIIILMIRCMLYLSNWHEICRCNTYS